MCTAKHNAPASIKTNNKDALCALSSLENEKDEVWARTHSMLSWKQYCPRPPPLCQCLHRIYSPTAVVLRRSAPQEIFSGPKTIYMFEMLSFVPRAMRFAPCVWGWSKSARTTLDINSLLVLLFLFTIIYSIRPHSVCTAATAPSCARARCACPRVPTYATCSNSVPLSPKAVSPGFFYEQRFFPLFFFFFISKSL